MSIKCKSCMSIIKSTHKHDFVGCKCYEHSRSLYNRFYEVLKEKAGKGITLDENSCLDAFAEVVFTGIAVDGGDDYMRLIGDIDNYEFIKDKEQ